MADVFIEDFEEKRKYALWENLFSSPEAFIALTFVVAECERVSELVFFSSDYGKSAPLDEFENLQRQTTQNVSRPIFLSFTRNMQILSPRLDRLLAIQRIFI